MNEIKPAELLTHEIIAHHQIRSALARAARGIDRIDKDLMLSAFHPGALDHHGTYDGTAEGFADWAVARHKAGILASTHIVTNEYIEVKGNVAYCESYSTGVQRYMKDGQLYDVFAGGRYIDRFELRDGAWKIAERTCVVDWDRIDPVTERFEGPLTKDLTQGRRTREDYSYKVMQIG